MKNGEKEKQDRGEYVAIEEDADAADVNGWHAGAILNSKIFMVNNVCLHASEMPSPHRTLKFVISLSGGGTFTWSTRRRF